MEIFEEYSLEGMENADGLRLNFEIKEKPGHARTETASICSRGRKVGKHLSICLWHQLTNSICLASQSPALPPHHCTPTPWDTDRQTDRPLRVGLTYKSLYWSKALLASTSSLRRRAEGMAPSSRGGSYLLLHGDLPGRQGQGQSDRGTRKQWQTAWSQPWGCHSSRGAIAGVSETGLGVLGGPIQLRTFHGSARFHIGGSNLIQRCWASKKTKRCPEQCTCKNCTLHTHFKHWQKRGPSKLTWGLFPGFRFDYWKKKLLAFNLFPLIYSTTRLQLLNIKYLKLFSCKYKSIV